MAVQVHVVRVFSDSDGRHGNPLGIVDATSVVDDVERQALAKHLGFSETVFVDVPDPGTRTARARIFTPVAELPFAGHPTVGLAWWLDANGLAVDALEVPAGRVETRARHGATWVRSQPDWAPELNIHPMPYVEDVVHARAHDFTGGHHYIWAWEDELEGRIRSRMFAPDLGIAEDEATGSAAVRITAHLRRALLIVQGRGSRIRTTFGDDGTVEVGRAARDDPARGSSPVRAHDRRLTAAGQPGRTRSTAAATSSSISASENSSGRVSRSTISQFSAM